jgi:hypothetical protein
MQTGSTPTPKPEFQPPVTLAVRLDGQLTKLEHDVAIIAAWQEYLTLGRPHHA